MKKLLLSFLICFSGISTILAQNSALLFGSTHTPQSNALNPAFYPKDNLFYVSLLGITPEMHLPLAYNDLFLADKSNNRHYINAWELGEKFQRDNNMFLNTDIQYLGFGIKLHDFFATFSANTKLHIHLGIPTGLASVFANRFDGLAGKVITISDQNLMQTTAYNELAFGGGYSISDFTVGARAKLINGICDLRTTQTNFRLKFNDDNELCEALIDYSLVKSGTQIFRQKNFGDVMSTMFSGKNWGFSFDIGAKYKWNMIEVSASLLDIGKGIHWRKEDIEITPHSNLPIIINNANFGHLVMDNWDSLMHSFSIALDSIQINDSAVGEEYWSPIPTKLNLGATVTFGNIYRAGVLFHGEWDKNISFFDRTGNPVDKTMFRHTTSLFFGANLANWVELMASLSVVKSGKKADWFNPGLGANFSIAKRLQIYALINYVSHIKYKEIKGVNLQFGFNLMFGNRILAKLVNNGN